MSIRSPFQIKKLEPKHTRETILDVLEVNKLVAELHAFKDRAVREHEQNLRQIASDHKAHMTVINEHVFEAKKAVKGILKGDRGEKGNTVIGPPGPKGDTPAIEDIVQAIKPHLPPGKSGKDAPPLNKIVKDVLEKMPTPKDVVLDIPAIAEAVLEEIKNNDKLKIEHFPSLKTEIASYRAQLAGKHYGKDTMVRGGGSSSSSGGGGGGTLTSETPSGTINGSNVTFTVANTPVQVFLNGALQTGGGVDYSISGLNITFVNPPLTNSILVSWYFSSVAQGTPKGEAPSGTINSVNVTFTLSQTPSPAAFLQLYLGRQLQIQGTDYTLSGATITYVTAPDILLVGLHYAYYTY